METPIHLKPEGPATEVLDAVLAQADGSMTWVLQHRASLVGPEGRVPSDYALRIFDVTPLIERNFDAYELCDFLSDFDGGSPWTCERHGTSIESAGPLLFILVDDRTHIRIEALLERLLNFAAEAEARAT